MEKDGSGNFCSNIDNLYANEYCFLETLFIT